MIAVMKKKECEGEAKTLRYRYANRNRKFGCLKRERWESLGELMEDERCVVKGQKSKTKSESRGAEGAFQTRSGGAARCF